MDCKKLYEKYRGCILNNTFNGTYAYVECREKELDYLKCKKKEEMRIENKKIIMNF